MSKQIITIGSIIKYLTVDNKVVKGQVEYILDNTVVIKDEENETHLVLKKTIEKDGISIDEKTSRAKVPFSINPNS